jgi:hypothetical protein
MTLKELEPQLLALSDDEKAQVVQLLSQGRITLGRGIKKRLVFAVEVPVLRELASPFGDL